MVTLDDRILGEKLQNYCSSSSEDEDDSPSKSDDEKQTNCRGSKFIPDAELESYRSQSNFTENTGPKGVIKDWQRFKQLETENRNNQEKEKAELIKKLSLSCRSHLDEERDQERQKNEAAKDDLDDEFFDAEDEFLKEYRAKLMNEIQHRISNAPRFGKVIQLTRDEYTHAIDKENKNVTVVVHIYEESKPACKTMNTCFHVLAEQYSLVKFCRIQASDAELSRKFIATGCPAILVYREGKILGNFVSLTNEFGDEFYPSDIENLLLENNLLPSLECSSSIRQCDADKSDSKSDDD
ncbi:unnamed protein product [Didymodactylos carnosus]|uniref:Phosducin domain-containing protein n=1 Tax=Didymodactylos carnosus TaxID=1234261 RepID=A0A813P3T8_9BILA|nr:unnamed protein product [Didymodactylos carnosus]CAF1262246.1 unnamed protein product [Didymodactylos carnosus]CAF3526207.1 unnamed protein product [Didymodactylos carnosus]CAF4068677.1 unnamed protein product [Didymodactylos carnosus]